MCSNLTALLVYGYCFSIQHLKFQQTLNLIFQLSETMEIFKAINATYRRYRSGI